MKFLNEMKRLLEADPAKCSSVYALGMLGEDSMGGVDKVEEVAGTDIW